MKIEWLTTAVAPRSNYVIGWKTHAVEATSESKFSELNGKRALCGLIPRHGWDMDLFITDKCKRCEEALKRCLKATS